MKFLTLFIALISALSLHSQEFNGIWASDGYGLIFDITTSNVDAYDYTSISLIYEDWYDLNGSQFGSDDEYMGNFSLVGGQLLLTTTGGTLIYFDAISALPIITDDTDDPQTNFDIFWQTYHEWTSIFAVNPIGWQQLYNQYSQLIDNTTTDAELFGYMEALLIELNDGHSYVDDDNGNEFYGGPDIPILWDGLEYEMMGLVEENYILGASYNVTGNGQITYGMLNDSVGYLAVNSFDDFDPDGNELDDNVVFSAAVDEAMMYFQNALALIVDVRFNYGGFDSNSRILANRLVATSIPVYSKQVRSGGYNEFLDPLTFFTLEPAGVQFLDRPVVILTSKATLSAADVFVMASKEIPCVTLIGEASYGIFSDNFTKYLPNGWEFGISPERYLDVDGVNWEQQGITPDIEVTGSLNDFENGVDNILEYALEEIFDSCVPSGIGEEFGAEFRVYPNPAKETLFVTVPLHFRVKNIQIIDGYGRSIETQYPADDEGLVEIEIKNLTLGVYLIELQGESGLTAIESFIVH